MADYDSDSSGDNNDVETNVLLGYASQEPTEDEFSQLGGYPTWLDDRSPPSAYLAKCKVCNGYTNLLLQLNADLPGDFPGHERRLYLVACKRKACRRKVGSVRAFRGSKQQGANTTSKTAQEPAVAGVGLGDALFGSRPAGNTAAGRAANPFATPSSSAAATSNNPFAPASALAAKPPQPPSHANNGNLKDLPETFASKARLASTEEDKSTSDSLVRSLSKPPPYEPWPSTSAFPPAYPSYHLDAEKEFLEPEDSTSIPQNARLDTSGEGSSGSGGGLEDKAAFESTLDHTFQRFADRLSQNPEQVLRYEWQAQPLLYSKSDQVGALFATSQDSGSGSGIRTSSASGSGKSKIPRCANCGAGRVFELQLTPHLIAMLEAEDEGLEGMDWGTVILGVCTKDCIERKAAEEGTLVGYVEEWVGVQWEELTGKGKAGAGSR
ncbi:hypothetical protein K431DRAFT_337399 [Polychaeton citri CBS 116435]|uniref:Programmed cell death protein 2 C-terminal domain-containing protein n=1 Tax=Polychaeton citri CBS 116435 TaxID=1314669 RepID=A0A9P4UPG5_9PEZI|nr:hypothetical protein K431DRAFT_337399 [Polychaeton citri CBS 116435]